MESRIIQAYRDYVALHGRLPNTLLEIAKAASLTEAEVLHEVTSLQALLERSWKHDLATTLERLNNDPAYTGYGARERLLAFYYTWIEVLKQNHSFYQQLLTGKHGNFTAYTSPRFIRKDFVTYVQLLLDEGKGRGEVEDRMFVSKVYAPSLWPQFHYILSVWVRDSSAGFSHTDAAIEKSVNLAFDALGRNVLDAFADFVKFNVQAVFSGK